jgi:hypothetical protein
MWVRQPVPEPASPWRRRLVNSKAWDTVCDLGGGHTVEPDDDALGGHSDEWLTRARSPLEELLADKVPARIVGGAVGTAIGAVGGPVGAVVGGWIGSGSSPIIEHILKRGNERYVSSAEHVVEHARTGAGLSVEEVLDWLTESPEHLDTMAVAVRAAFETLDENKIRSLARALQVGLDDEARLDEARLAITALAQLESMHLRVLQFYVQAKWQGGFGLDPAQAFPKLAIGMPRILATLQREGLTSDNPGGHRTVTSFGEYVYWLTRASRFDTAPFIHLTYGTTRGLAFAVELVRQRLGGVEIADQVGRDDRAETFSGESLERRWHARTDNVDELILVHTGSDAVMAVEARTTAGRKTRKSAHSDFAVVSIFTQRAQEVDQLLNVRHLEQMWKPTIADIPFHPRPKDATETADGATDDDE